MMATKDSLGRLRHVDLSSMQRRLRHLRSVSARNIVPNFALSGDTLLEYLLQTYFTLHHPDDKSIVYYRSERIKHSLNPTWVSFEPSKWPEELNTATRTFIICVWGLCKDNHKLLVEWKVDLASLQYAGDQIRNTKYASNTLIFGLVDGFYWAVESNKNSKSTLEAKGATKNNSKLMRSQLDQVTSSYNLSLLLRFQNILRAIKQTRISTHEVKWLIRERLQGLMRETSEVGEQESLKLKLKILQEELTSKEATLEKESVEEKRCNKLLKERESALNKRKKDLAEHWSRLKDSKQAHIAKRESLVKLNAQLNMRRRQLASELMYIYPIIELDSKELVVCGVKFPNCESGEFFAMDEETLSVALGYVCHLVYMIGKLLELPLRYPMVPAGSRSFAVDYTIEKVTDRDREFPLYTKGKEKIQFYYGVFLLNKNIAQLRQFCGLATQNLRNTLPNLKDLLDTRFRASEPLKSPPMPIVGPAPNLKPRSTGSRGSTDSPPRNPQLDDIILQNMDSASLGGIKPPLPPQPVVLLTKDNPQFKMPQQTATHKFIGQRTSKKGGSKQSHSAVSLSKNVTREEKDRVRNEKDEFLRQSASPLSGDEQERKGNAAVISESNSVSSADFASLPTVTTNSLPPSVEKAAAVSMEPARNAVTEHVPLKTDCTVSEVADATRTNITNSQSVDFNASVDTRITRASSD